MKRIIIITLLGISSFAFSSPLPDFPFIFATGEAQTNVVPDSAVMAFEIIMFNKDAKTAISEIQNQSALVSALLLQSGLSRKSIVAYEIDKSAVREENDYDELDIIGYEVSQRFELTINDLSLYEKIAIALFEMNYILDLDTKFKRADEKSIKALLVSVACKDAKEQAMLLSAGMGQELGAVFSISQRGFENIFSRFGFAQQSAGFELAAMEQGFDWTRRKEKGEEFLFIPSTISFNSSVSVIFKLKE